MAPALVSNDWRVMTGGSFLFCFFEKNIGLDSYTNSYLSI